MALPPVRRRIPPFHTLADRQPQLDYGKHDRLKVVVRGRIQHGGLASLSHYLTAISSGGIFNRPRPVGYSAQLRLGSHPHPGHFWLFNVNILFRGVYNHGATVASSAPVQIELDINPTRFAAHRTEAFEDVLAMSSNEALTSSDRRRASIIQHTLDGQDNFIAQSRNTIAYLPGQWNTLLNAYWTHLTNFIDGQFDPDRSGMRDRHPDISWQANWADVTVRQSEVYWEYLQPMAAQLVRRLAERMRGVHDMTVRRYYDEEHDQYGTVLRWALREHVDAVVYAKTDHRLRIEIRYNEPPSNATSPRPTDVVGLVSVLDHIRHDAHLRIPGVLGAILERISPDSGDAIERFTFLFSAISSATGGDADLTSYIWIRLATSGGLAANDDNVPQNVRDALFQSNFLTRYRIRRRTPSGLQRYALSPEEAQMMSSFNNWMNNSDRDE